MACGETGTETTEKQSWVIKRKWQDQALGVSTDTELPTTVRAEKHPLQLTLVRAISVEFRKPACSGLRKKWKVKRRR